jgi:hypothetical protein
MRRYRRRASAGAQHGRLPGAVKDGGRWLLDARERDKALAGGRSDLFRTSPAEGDR